MKMIKLRFISRIILFALLGSTSMSFADSATDLVGQVGLVAELHQNQNLTLIRIETNPRDLKSLSTAVIVDSRFAHNHRGWAVRILEIVKFKTSDLKEETDPSVLEAMTYLGNPRWGAVYRYIGNEPLKVIDPQ